MISHKHKCIFIHIPKCGGISVENMFLNDLGLSWNERRVLVMGKNYNSKLNIPRLAHLSLDQMVDNFYLNDMLIESYFKFTVVRSPFSRVRSFYNYLGYSNFFSFKKFVCDVLPKELDSNSTGLAWFFKPQSEYLYYKGKLSIDKILYLESISEEIEFIINNFGLNSRLEHKNASGTLPISKKIFKFLSNLKCHINDIELFHKNNLDFDEEMIQIVKSYYYSDFAHFSNYDI